MCAHKECADALLQLGIGSSLARLKSSPDATVQKYVQRIQVELCALLSLGISHLSLILRLSDCKKHLLLMHSWMILPENR